MNSKPLSQSLAIGDMVFIHVDVLPFRKIARDTGSWSNHVGIITDIAGGEPTVSESTFPFSKHTSFSIFIGRSKDRRATVKRLPEPLTPSQRTAIRSAADKRIGRFYDTGFNLFSRRQFCSRFVYEVLKEALGIEIGQVQTLRALFSENPHADMHFWRLWYFGKIPWNRETVTPASQLNHPTLLTVFEGYVSD